VLSNKIEVAVNETRSLNCVVRGPVSIELETESNAMLYSVRPHKYELPAGVYFTAEGIVKFELV
jgi:hypothetical protein